MGDEATSAAPVRRVLSVGVPETGVHVSPPLRPRGAEPLATIADGEVVVELWEGRASDLADESRPLGNLRTAIRRLLADHRNRTTLRRALDCLDSRADPTDDVECRLLVLVERGALGLRQRWRARGSFGTATNAPDPRVYELPAQPLADLDADATCIEVSVCEGPREPIAVDYWVTLAGHTERGGFANIEVLRHEPIAPDAHASIHLSRISVPARSTTRPPSELPTEAEGDYLEFVLLDTSGASMALVDYSLLGEEVATTNGRFTGDTIRIPLPPSKPLRSLSFERLPFASR